jgi:integrase
VPSRIDTPLLFPASKGGHINLDNRRTRVVVSGTRGAGVRGRGPYALRDTFATEALAGGISIFHLSRVMGASVKTIDKHYGHLAHDGEGAIYVLLETRSGS